MSQLIDSSVARQFDRLPPHSIEAEMCLLGSMMLEKEIVGQAVQLVDRDAFYQADHQIIFDVLLKLYEMNRPIDAVILFEELVKRQLLEEVGGKGYIGQILNSVPSAAHGMHYAGIVREKAMLRQLIGASNDILRDAYAAYEQAEIVLDKAEKRIFEIAEKKVGGAMEPMEKVLHEVFEMIENRGQRGLETGFHEMDDMLNGLQKGEMIIVAARPSMGKTALAMNMVEHVAADLRLPCAIFSLEMSKQQLAQRMLCSRGQIDAHKLRKGMLNSQEYTKLATVVGELAKAPIWVDDSASLTPLDLRAKARRLKLQHDVKCLVIDYMQLDGQSGSGESPATNHRDFPRDKIGGPRTEHSGDLRVAVEPGLGGPRRPSPADERFARIGQHRAGCRRGDDPASRGLLQNDRAGFSARQRRGNHHRQAEERADRDDQADVPQQDGEVREPQRLDGPISVMRLPDNSSQICRRFEGESKPLSRI